MPKLILLRHGQSKWNLQNRFTGWWDVDVTEKGVEEARAAGRLMREKWRRSRHLLHLACRPARSRRCIWRWRKWTGCGCRRSRITG